MLLSRSPGEWMAQGRADCQVNVRRGKATFHFCRSDTTWQARAYWSGYDIQQEEIDEAAAAASYHQTPKWSEHR